MIPENNIVAAISSLWVEKFPEENATAFPKGIVKRVSMNPVRSKDAIITGQFNTRTSILWYAKNPLLFDTQMTTIINAMDGINVASEINNVSYEGRTDGYDDTTDMHVMNLDFIVKHTL